MHFVRLTRKSRRAVVTGAMMMLFGCLLPGAAATAEPPKVVASILPIHSLAAAVMAGVAEPELLVEGAASPHSFSLKPSDARALDEADLVIWVGPGLELFLQRPLANLGEGVRVLTVSELGSLNLLPVRSSGLHVDSDDEDHHHHGHGHHHDDGDKDLHLWLDPANGAAIGRTLAEVLAELDPLSADRYRENAERLTAELGALEEGIQRQLAPYRGQEFLVFHDAYQYFEEAFSLRSAGSIALDPERQPGARRLQQIRDWIGEKEAVCVFAEPQFEPRLLSMLVEGTQARLGQLDPLGATLEPGSEAYVALLGGISDNFAACFEHQQQ